MTSKIHNKLVRDKIPEIIIAEKGKHPITRILNDDDYLTALLCKLEEECMEFKADLSIEEMADVQEVILAIIDALDIDKAQLEKVRLDKAAERGSFKNRIFLERVDED